MFIFQATPPEILVDFNMTDERGVVPALVKHIRGFRPATLYVGQRFLAVDADENTAEALVFSVEGQLLRLYLVPASAEIAIDTAVPVPSGEIEVSTRGSTEADVIGVQGNPEPLVAA